MLMFGFSAGVMSESLWDYPRHSCGVIKCDCGLAAVRNFISWCSCLNTSCSCSWCQGSLRVFAWMETHSVNTSGTLCKTSDKTLTVGFPKLAQSSGCCCTQVHISRAVKVTFSPGVCGVGEAPHSLLNLRCTVLYGK